MLNNKRYLKIAKNVANLVKIKLPDDDIILKMLRKKSNIQPMVFMNKEYQMWLDKYYIAYSALDETDINYVYLTKFHINEEISSYKLAEIDRGNYVDLPLNVYKSFIKAKYIMRKTGKEYYLDEMFIVNQSKNSKNCNHK